MLLRSAKAEARASSFVIKTYGPNELFDITGRLEEFLKEIKAEDGLLVVESMGSTGALLVASPSVTKEIKRRELWELVPIYMDWLHEGNAYAHLRSTVIGTSLALPVRRGRLAIGGRRVYFVENQCYNLRERIINLAYVGTRAEGGKTQSSSILP